MKLRFVILASMFLSLGSAVAVWTIDRPADAATVVASDNLPTELYRVASSTRTLEVLASGELRVTLVDWDSKRREFYVYRRHREDAQSAWSALQKQTVTTSFDIADIVSLCDPDLDIRRAYVAGTYDNGTSTIERWDFVETVGSPGGFGGGSETEITVNRTVLYQGTSLGIIASLAVDPDTESQLLVLTYGTGKLMRLPLSGVSSPVLVYDTTTIAELSNAVSMSCRKHVMLGAAYYLNSTPRWRRSMYKDEVPPNVIILWDSDSDQIPDSHQVLSWSQYRAQGHDDLENFVSPCR